MEPERPRHPAEAVLVWSFRGFIAYGFGEMVDMALKSAAWRCRPDFNPNMWPFLGPVLGFCAVTALVAGWLVGFIPPKFALKDTHLLVLAQTGITFVAFVFYFFAMMVMSFMTLC